MNIYSLASLIASIFCIALGSFVYLSKGRSIRRKLFAFASVLTGLWTLFPFALSKAPSEQSALFFARLTYLAAVVTPSAWLHFMLSITSGGEIKEEKRPLFLSYGVSLFFLLFCFSPFFLKGVVRFAPYFSVIPGPAYPFFIFSFSIVFFYILYKIYQNFRITHGYVKNQLKYIMLSYIFGFFSGILHFGAAYFNKELFPHDFLIIVYTGLIWYAIFQYKLMDIEHVIAMIMTFAIVCIPIVTIPFVIGYFTQSWILCGVFASIFTPVGFHLYNRAKRRVITEQLAFQDAIIEIIEDIKHVRAFDKLSSMIVGRLLKKFGLIYVGFYLLNTRNKEYLLVASESSKPHESNAGIRYTIGADEALVKLLLEEKEPIVYEELKSKSYDTKLQSLKEAEIYIKSINAAIVIPIFYREKQEELMAVLVLGDRLSGRPYGNSDRKALKSLAEHIALAIKNAQFIEDLNKAHTELLQASIRKHLAEMADGMSHQFHNRFIGITFPAGFAKDVLSKIDLAKLSGDDQDRIKKAINAMERAESNAVKGGDIARGLLKFSRPDKEGYKMIDVSEGLDLAIEMVEYKHPDFSQIEIKKEIEDGLPLVWANLSYLQDMYFIVIDNAYDAIKYKIDEDSNFKGEISVTITNDKDKKNIHIAMKDNGAGMTREILQKVKAAIPYMTTKASSDKSGYGAGIQMLRRFVDFHDGKLDYDSIHEKGTLVIIDIPITKKPND